MLNMEIARILSFFIFQSKLNVKALFLYVLLLFLRDKPIPAKHKINSAREFGSVTSAILETEAMLDTRMESSPPVILPPLAKTISFSVRSSFNEVAKGP